MFHFVTVWKILSINVVFHDTLKINSCLGCLYLKNIHFWSILCSHAIHSQSAIKLLVQKPKPRPRKQIKYIANKQTALIGYTVTSFLRRLLQFLKAELRSIIDVNH